ncbi:MAG TPA: hypothetical protein VH592_05020 [Gemmataceae bacterium]|jgi:hypothetical protein
MTEELITHHVAGCFGEVVDRASTATVEGLTADGVVVRLPSGTRTILFREIIDADAVLRYWLAQRMVPTTDNQCDFRSPDNDIGVGSISECYYAPTFAERVRRADTEIVVAEGGDA